MRTVLALAFIVAACASSSSSRRAVSPPPSAVPESHRPADTGAVSEEEFKAMHAPPTTGTAVLKGQMIDLAGTRVYLSLPAGAGPFPAIVVIHEWWGLNANIEHWADRLASAGWAAIAVDLYSGTVATTPDEAMKAMKAVDETKAAATISAALELAKTDPRIRATKRAVIGWCFGGGWSMQTALAHPELDGAIIYYGQLETDPAKLAAIKGKVLGVFANKDRGIPPAVVDRFEAALAQAKVPAEIHQYDAEHAFANPSNPRYDETSAADAWAHVLAFLQALSR